MDAGSRAGFTGSRPPSPWTSVLLFPKFRMVFGFEKLGLIDHCERSELLI